MSGGSTTITAERAQAEHDALAMTGRGDQHRASSWRSCEACRRRHQSTNTQVIN